MLDLVSDQGNTNIVSVKCQTPSSSVGCFELVFEILPHPSSCPLSQKLGSVIVNDLNLRAVGVCEHVSPPTF